MAQRIDEDIRGILDAAYQQAMDIVTEQRSKLVALLRFIEEAQLQTMADQPYL